MSYELSLFPYDSTNETCLDTTFGAITMKSDRWPQRVACRRAAPMRKRRIDPFDF
jgi:hypothetical protein